MNYLFAFINRLFGGAGHAESLTAERRRLATRVSGWGLSSDERHVRRGLAEAETGALVASARALGVGMELGAGARLTGWDAERRGAGERCLDRLQLATGTSARHGMCRDPGIPARRKVSWGQISRGQISTRQIAVGARAASGGWRATRKVSTWQLGQVAQLAAGRTHATSRGGGVSAVGRAGQVGQVAEASGGWRATRRNPTR